MTLTELVHHLEVVSTTGALDRAFGAVVHDSRRAGPDDVFVAIRGGTVDGRRFVPGLRVAAVIADADVQPEPGVALIRVPDARVALSRAAALAAGQPSDRLDVVGITGTNGKTTLSYMVEALATHAGRPTGVIGTTGNRIAGQALPASHTTPEAPVLHDLLGRMVDAGCTVAAIEISSIGLALHRADDVHLSVGVFTSFTQDHLDFHGTMEAYLQAKLRLFSVLLRSTGTAVVCGTDPVADRVLAACGDRRAWRYGQDPRLEIHATAVQHHPGGVRARVHTPAGEGELVLALPGPHNLDNALGALGAGLALGIPLQACLEGLATLGTVPGRMQRVADPGGRVVLVDYAHTPDALDKALAAARSVGPGTLHVVFGCGGDRDPGKRPTMGRIAEEHADFVWLTSDNPRSEDPAAIIAQVRAGMQAGPDRLQVEPDRARAIQAALAAAQPGDIVLIAGKGHERTQEIAGRTLPFDDCEVARAALAALSPSPASRRTAEP